MSDELGQIQSIASRLEDIRDERHFPAHMIDVHDEMVAMCETLTAALKSPERGELASLVDFEGLGDALFALSAQLKDAGFLADPAHHATYERVVVEFQKLSPALHALSASPEGEG